jgi:hypothetical protein
MKRLKLAGVVTACLACVSCTPEEKKDAASLQACLQMAGEIFQPVAADRADRFQAKVSRAAALCRGGQKAVDRRDLPWVDWGNYFGAGDVSSNAPGIVLSKGFGSPGSRGVAGSLFDLEAERVELIKFNLFDNSGTFREYIAGRNGVGGPALKSWPEFRLPPEHANYAEAGGSDPQQVCAGELIRARTLSGICNDELNPLMGATGQLFGRNVEFESSFPELSSDPLARNRHGDRLGLMKPDPQVISRLLLSRKSDMDYQKASTFNALAGYWIQFMTHDWFSHMEEGHNDTSEFMPAGCSVSPEEARRIGCRPDDRIDRGYVAQDSAPGTFTNSNRQYAERSPKTMRNTNTAWWDASQIYGYDDVSVKRVKRDPADRAKLLLTPLPGGSGGYLPLLQASDPMNPDWSGQESTAFADNWTVGLSVLTNIFAREHDAFVDAFRAQAKKTPNADSGLRNPSAPRKVVRYADATDDELYNVARLVVAAEIAKIHTIEWTPQLLYDEPLHAAMNANWSGLLGDKAPELTRILQDVIAKHLGQSKDPRDATRWYSILASGPGIVGIGSGRPGWDITKPEFTNGGVNHFGVPFNFPEEFISVYRLHPLIPDRIEYRDLKGDPNRIVERVPVVDTLRAKATAAMHTRGIANWTLSLGRQRVGALTLRNHPMFLQNLPMSRLPGDVKVADVAALDIIRDREHGIPRFNEFRRQYGLRTLTSFDDFIDQRTPAASPERLEQEDRARTMRQIYGQHVCDASKVITRAQKWADGSPINDCLGKPNGSMVDNVEDVDSVVGYLAEPVRPHGFAISETQFVVFILNASRRLFSDRFLTSSFRPEFYTTMGLNWVNNNGPTALMEKTPRNGHTQAVSPLKRVLMRTIPELSAELETVGNAFDPWARKTGEYYSAEWMPRAGAEGDDAFKR